jgi:hypothetical protein
MILCVVIVAAGVLLAVGGIGGAWVPAMVTLGCIAMMGAMMWMMAGGRDDHGHRDADAGRRRAAVRSMLRGTLHERQPGR